MFDIQVDVSKNLVRLSWQGRIEPDEASRCLATVETRLPAMPRGFRLLADLTELESMNLGCVPSIKKMMDICNQQGVAMVVRVIPDPRQDIGFSILSLFHYDRGVRIITCKTLAEALTALEPG